MLKQTQFDLVTLSAVKPGMDEALGKVGVCLGRYLEDTANNLPSLNDARAELRRVSGVLRMVRLDGLAVYCAELEKILAELAENPGLASPLYHTVLQTALTGLTHYLDGLMQGAANATLRLFPKYEAMQHLRGMEMSFEQDLFFPNLDVALPESVLNIARPSGRKSKIRAAHSKYQHGLVRVWREHDLGALPGMQEALDTILSCEAQDNNRAFWWVANGLLECVRLEGVPLERNVRNLLVSIDRRLRATINNNTENAYPLLCEMLFLIGHSSATGDLAEQIKQHYALESYMPVQAVQITPEHRKELEKLRLEMQEAEGNWESCVGGDGNACAKFVGYVEKVAKKSDSDASDPSKTLSRQIGVLAEYLRDPVNARLIGEDVAMALLLWQSGIANQETLETGFREQARKFLEQIEAAISQKPAQTQRVESLISGYRQNEQGAVMASLADEMLLNLEHVEQTMNAFFEDTEKRAELSDLQEWLEQIHGGLSVLSLEAAQQLLQEIQASVNGYMRQGKTPNLLETHAMAGAVATLYDYLQHLMHGREDRTATLTEAYRELSAINQHEPLKNHPSVASANDTAPDFRHPLDEDRELLNIFLEEAHEVLGIMHDNVEFSQLYPADQEPLIVIRRGFHTLKGSGRMVGLTDIGEVAWAAERAMNQWLQDKKPASPELLHFIETAVQQFSVWVADLEKRGVVSIQSEALVALAQQIENGVDSGLAAPYEAIPAPQQMHEVVELPVAEHENLAADAPVFAEHQDQDEHETVMIGEIAISPVLFDIASEEARQHVLAMHHHLDLIRTSHPPVVEYDFMRAAHTLAGVCRNTGFTAAVSLAAALENWLQAHLDKSASPSVEKFQMLEQVVSALDAMVQDISARKMPEPCDELVERVLHDKDRVLDESDAALTGVEAQAGMEVPDGGPVTGSSSERAQSEISGEVIGSKREVKERKAILHDDVDAQLLPVFIEEADELCPKIGACLRALRETAEDEPSLQLLKRLLHTLKGSARMTGAMRIGEIAHNMEGHLLAGSQQNGAELWDTLESDFDRANVLLEELRSGKVEEHLEAVVSADHSVVEADRRAETRALNAGAERVLLNSMLRVRSDVVDRLVNQAGEISVTRSRIEAELRAFKEGLLELSGSVSRLRKQLREVEIQAESQIQARISLANENDEQFDPLEFDRFTRLQELTRFMNESVHDVQTVQQSLLKNMDETTAAMTAQARLNRDLQQNLMNVRMVPFGSMSERLYRIVRQTGKDLNKRANLELIGTGVELDRSVLERMAAPFEHLLRNALAHGLEDEQLRINSGKEAIGEIRLDLRQESNEVVFEFSDDGRGLDFAALRAKAISKGLLEASDDTVSDDQLAQLIFTSGVSTASEVTEVAGRGIGMDVVRSEITALGGRVDVRSTAGVGTNFTIHLPLTLAVTQVLMVRAGETIYAIPSTMVEQVRQVKPAELAAVYAEHKVLWQDKAYPLNYLPALLGDDERVPESLPHNPLVLLRSGEQRIALHVDEMLGNQEAVVKNIGPQLARMPGIAGATVMGNGAVVLILNPLQMKQRIAATARKVQETVPLHVQPLVMVVDDSLTVRKITTRLLTRAGYQVVTANDGVDALERLNEVTPDVMLLDIEMPRMDGFELAKLLRRDEKTKNLPIIMITSRTADKHRDHAMQLGVNAYMGKPYQEDELLAQIGQLLAG